MVKKRARLRSLKAFATNMARKPQQHSLVTMLCRREIVGSIHLFLAAKKVLEVAYWSLVIVFVCVYCGVCFSFPTCYQC